jgi:hypothetical protein
MKFLCRTPQHLTAVIPNWKTNSACVNIAE